MKMCGDTKLKQLEDENRRCKDCIHHYREDWYFWGCFIGMTYDCAILCPEYDRKWWKFWRLK